MSAGGTEGARPLAEGQAVSRSPRTSAGGGGNGTATGPDAPRRPRDPAAARRARRCRQRRRKGLRVLRVAVEFFPTVEALLEHGVLTAEDALDDALVVAAIERVLATMLRRR